MEPAFKYHGLGNDFVVLDRRATGIDIDAPAAQRLCDRRRGVGADGVLVLLPAAAAAARMVVHNADGSVPEMCGNGLRCAVKYLVDHASSRPAQLEVETGVGVLRCTVAYGVDQLAEEIQVAMGPARLVADNLPSGATGEPYLDQPLDRYAPGAGRGSAINLGNPHLVLFDPSLGQAARLGPLLERHPGFPERTNVELCRVVDGGLEVVVWERGVGLTQACGTGACAAVVAAGRTGRLPLGGWTRVLLPGGALQIEVAADLSTVALRGPAVFVFEAQVP